MDFDERIVVAAIDASDADIRRLPESDPIYDAGPARYGAARRFADAVRAAGPDGIVYSSVCATKGSAVGAFTPRVIRNARTDGYIGLHWDGKRITDTYHKPSLTTGYP